MTGNSQVQSTIRRLPDELPPEVLLPLLHDLQLALPWLATGVPGAMAGITTYLQRCGDTQQWQALQHRLEQGDDAGLQALACMAFHQLRVSRE
ncbi:MAG: hypothetical protein O9312_11705 [Hylemonella sp.]|nr:hypothetical protein [Hylemonella sp.]